MSMICSLPKSYQPAILRSLAMHLIANAAVPKQTHPVMHSRTADKSSQNPPQHLSMNIRQPEVTARIPVRQLLVVHAQQMQNGGM